MLWGGHHGYGDDRFFSLVQTAVHRISEWQRIGNQINAAMIFARADFVNVHGMHSGWRDNWLGTLRIL